MCGVRTGNEYITLTFSHSHTLTLDRMEQHIKLPEGSIEKTTTTLNLGPTHPATHGVFQNILELDGERIVSAEQTVGYIHRAFEKIAERRPLYQITPLTDLAD
jgi:NADH-quinone oxidoreductase subunit D